MSISNLTMWVTSKPSLFDPNPLSSYSHLHSFHLPTSPTTPPNPDPFLPFPHPRGSLPTTKEAQAIIDDVFSHFVREEVDKVELLYTKFVSLVKSDPIIHTLLPLSPKGKICDVNGNCVDATEDELFWLTTKEGKLIVERDTEILEIVAGANAPT
ncbi:hypothetical protein AAC387_Pa09g0401 [Persea americana]